MNVCTPGPCADRIDKEDERTVMTRPNTNKEPMEAKYKRYWAIGIVIAIAVIALLVYHSGVLTKNQTAATVGGEKYTVSEVAYYYQAAANSTISTAKQYAQYGIDMGYDTDLSPTEQYYDEANGVTYADYFLDSALSQLQRVHILCAEAAAAGYTLSEEGQAAYDQNMNYLQMYSLQNGTSEESYLRLIYGRTMTMSLFKDVLHDAVLADDYAKAKTAEFTHTSDELDTYYNEHAAELDSYEYRSCYINYSVEEKTDDDGNTIEATDEEIAAAMDVAKAQADEMIAKVKAGTAFNEAAKEYVNETSAASFDDPEYNHMTDTLGKSLPSTFSEWMQDSSRQPGDMTAIEMTDTGYCVVQFLGRDKGDDVYQTVDFRSILVMAETTEGEDGTAAPTEDQLAAAKAQAEEFLAQFQSGTQDADSFAALAQANSADESTKENGGLNEGADRDTLSTSLSTWLFDTDRQVGDTAVVEYTDSTGATVGYQVLYLQQFGQVCWQYQAESTLSSEAYDEWYAEVEANYPAELTDAAHDIIPKL